MVGICDMSVFVERRAVCRFANGFSERDTRAIAKIAKRYSERTRNKKLEVVRRMLGHDAKTENVKISDSESFGKKKRGKKTGTKNC